MNEFPVSGLISCASPSASIEDILSQSLPLIPSAQGCLVVFSSGNYNCQAKGIEYFRSSKYE